MTNSSATFRSDGINNFSKYNNAEVDELLSQLDVTLDPEEQIDIQLQIDKLLMDDFYGLTIFQFPGVTAYSDRVENVNPGPLSPTIFWNVWDWAPTENN